MTDRVFKYEGNDWQVEETGIRDFPGTNRVSLIFRCLSDPRKPELKGSLRAAAATSEWSDKELARALVRARRRSKVYSQGKQVEAILTRCRIDANARDVRYDNTDGFVVIAEGGPVGRVKYVFKNQEEAYQAATKTMALRRHKRFD